MTAPSDTASGGRAALPGFIFSDPCAKVASAFVAAQSEFGDVVKDKTAKITSTKGAYSYTYADLGSALEAVLPALHTHKLGLLQPCKTTDSGAIAVTTMFLHESGEWMMPDEPLVMRPTNSDPQSAGSAITYARRYALLATCGLAAEDDDAQHASRPPERSQRPPRTNPPVASASAPTAAERPANSDLNAPGGASEESKAKLARALGLLSDFPGFDTAKELALFSEATNGRVEDGVLDELSENEARRLGKLLKPFVDEAKIRNEALESERAREQDAIAVRSEELPL